MRRLTLLVVSLAAAAALAAPSASAAKTAPTVMRGSIQAPAFGDQIDFPRAIVRVARAEFARDVREVPRGSNDSTRIALYRGALVPRARAAAWCAFFVSWVTRTAGAPVGRNGTGIASASGIQAWAQRTGRWRHSPRPGDVAVYSGHAGIVESVSGSRMTTIEGNWSDRVSRLSRRRGEAFGFARIASQG